MPNYYEVQHFTFCDGWINTWSDIEENGDETPSLFETEEEALQALNELQKDSEVYGMDFDREQYRIVKVNL